MTELGGEGRRDISGSLSVTWSQGSRTEGTRYFFLSIVGISVLSAFSQMTCSQTLCYYVTSGHPRERVSTYRDAIGVLLANALGFSLAFLWADKGYKQDQYR